MSIPVTIPKEVPKDSALSYDFLRSEGIKTIQRLAGDSWTDHNTHDPGITIMEQLCYAITDLAYRLDYDIKDILGNNVAAYNELYSPATILTNNPVTWSDLRKVVIDIKGVKNAWIEKIIAESEGQVAPKGLYQVIVEKDDLVTAERDLKQTIKERLSANRQLCEDFEEIRVFDKQRIQLTGTIEISDQTDDIHAVVADILYQIQTNLSPAIRFYTLQELLNHGKRIDEIFDGPVLEHGFINNEELERHDRKLEIHASDLIKEMMDVRGVVTVQELLVQSGINDGKNWVYYLDPTKTPTLNVQDTLQSLQFTIQGLKVALNTNQVTHLYHQKLLASVTKKELSLTEKDILLSVGKDRKIGSYYSLQNLFPINYGIGTSGLPNSATVQRKAQSRQLIAYLTLFDQLLANHFAQLGDVHKLLGLDSSMDTTYVTQSLAGVVPGLEEVLVSKEGYQNYLNATEEQVAQGIQRKNKFLNHLLARFGETFKTYTLGDQKEGNEAVVDRQKLIEDKVRFLQAYPVVSADRSKGFDYRKPYTKDDNFSGLEKRIALKLGVEKDEQFYMVEHLLLRPYANDATTFENYYEIGEIVAFEASDVSTTTICIVDTHNLTEGEQIRITQNETYNGTYTVQKVSATSFEIDIPFEVAGTNGTANWQRIQPNLRHHLFSNPIVSLETSPNAGHTFCNVSHTLKIGDLITIGGAQGYDGTHRVTNITDQGFEIEVPFDQNFTTARYHKNEVKDRYSLQLSFVFPEEVGRYQDPVFQNFVENMVREETPVHFTTHIYWATQQEITSFKKAHEDFMASIQQR
ncbi:hypothetical protein [Aquimarina rubra]|uniref:Uncharacterized protein n=1 Tax=Aquimarina rubra TaxID=1920033 RepID=A0ABW5LH47_9FLAO